MKWFMNFLKSFDNCTGRKISEKQFFSFESNLQKYVYKESETNNSFITEYHFLDKIIILQDSKVGYGKGWHEYYLTLKNNKDYVPIKIN